MAGSAIQWLRDGLKMLQTAAESEAVAKASTGHNEVYMWFRHSLVWAHHIGIHKRVGLSLD